MSFGSQALIQFARLWMLLKAVGTSCPRLPAEESCGSTSQDLMAGQVMRMSYHFGHYFQCFATRPLEHEARASFMEQLSVHLSLLLHSWVSYG